MIDHQPLYRITEHDRGLVAQFKDKPLGPHSPDLLRLLNRLRWEPLHGKFVLVCTRPHTEWTLGRVSAVRGEPIEILEGYVFQSRADAEWSVFKLRWERATSLSLDID